MIRKLITILFLAAPIFTCSSQDSLSIAKFDYIGNDFSPAMNKHVRKHRNTLSGYMSIYLSKNSQFIDTTCEVGAAMVKFRLKMKDGIVEVACTKSTRPDLAKIFKSIVERTSKYWTVKSDNDLYYILPIHYNFKSACGDRSIKKANMESNYLFDFDDGSKIGEAPCVILKSLKYMAGTGAKEVFFPPLSKD